MDFARVPVNQLLRFSWKWWASSRLTDDPCVATSRSGCPLAVYPGLAQLGPVCAQGSGRSWGCIQKDSVISKSDCFFGSSFYLFIFLLGRPRDRESVPREATMLGASLGVKRGALGLGLARLGGRDAVGWSQQHRLPGLAPGGSRRRA